MTKKIRKDAKSDARKARKPSLNKRTLKDLAPRNQGPKGGACTYHSAGAPRF